MNIGQRVVEIVIKGHDASVAAFKSLQSSATESKKKVKELADEVPGLSRAMSLVTNPLAAAAAVVVGLGVAMTKAYNASVKLGAGFMDMSNRTEMSVESLAKWKYIAEQNGASIDDFEAAFRKLRQTMADAANGDAAALKIFDTLGVKATDVSGNMRDLETVMLEIGQSIRQHGVASVQGAAGQDALGRSSSALVAIIKQQTGALAAQSAEAKVFSSNMTTAWSEAADAADDAGQRFTFAFANLRAAAVPAQTWLANAATSLIKGMSGKSDLEAYLKAEHDRFVQAGRESGLAAGEAATASMYEGLQSGFDKAPASDNSARLSAAILGDEEALKAKIAARIKADAEAAAQMAMVAWAAANEPVPLPLTAQPIVTLLPPQAPIKLIGNDDLYAEAMSIDLDAELNTGLNDQRIADIMAQTDAQRQATEALDAFNKEQMIADDLASNLKSGFEQVGAAALAAFMSGKAGAAEFGNAIRTMVTQAIAEAIAKFIILKILGMAKGGSVPGTGGGGGGSSIPAGMMALGGSIPHAAAGYAVPDGPRGRDSMLIAAMPGEEVINRQLSQRLDRFISSMEFGAAVSPFAMSGAGGGRGNVIVNFEVGRPVGVLDALSYGEVAATAARKVAERTI